MPATKERLAKVLSELDLPELADRARQGRYDDFESESETPIVDLVRDLERALKTHARPADVQVVIHAAKTGSFDATGAEAEAWAARQTDPEIVDLIKRGPVGLASFTTRLTRRTRH